MTLEVSEECERRRAVLATTAVSVKVDLGIPPPETNSFEDEHHNMPEKDSVIFYLILCFFLSLQQDKIIKMCNIIYTGKT